MNKENKNVRVAIIGITAALYVVLGYMFQPISFMGLQFRVATLIVGMALVFPLPGTIGNAIGVLLLNLSSPLGVLDMVVMPFVAFVAVGCIGLLRNKKYLKYTGGVIHGLFIATFVGMILSVVVGLPFWIMFIELFISDSILATLGIVLFNYIGVQMNL